MGAELDDIGESFYKLGLSEKQLSHVTNSEPGSVKREEDAGESGVP